MKIRKLKQNETSILKDFTYLALYVPEGEPPFSRDILDSPRISKYYKNIDLQREICYVAEDENQITGVVWGRYLTADNPGYGYYKDSYMELTISVLPEYRSKGIGRNLIVKFLKEAQERGVEGISLSVSYGNYAMKLYESLGFLVIKERETDILMVLENNQGGVDFGKWGEKTC